MACRAAPNAREGHAPTSTTHQHDPDQPYAYSGGGSSMDSELIPLESGELCVAAIATALSDNSKLIVAAQKNDRDITTVRNWISSDTFPECVRDFAPASYELKSYWIGRKSLYLDAEDVLWCTSCRSERATCSSLVPARHHLQRQSPHHIWWSLWHDAHTQQDSTTLFLARNVRLHQRQNHRMP